MSKKKILITGITGFVGSHMADWILEKNPYEEVEIHATKRYHLSKLDNVLHIEDKLTDMTVILQIPLLRLNLLLPLNQTLFFILQQRVLFPHLGIIPMFMTVNYNATLNILEGMRLSGKDDIKILIPGSGEEYGDIAEEDIPYYKNSKCIP